MKNLTYLADGLDNKFLFRREGPAQAEATEPSETDSDDQDDPKKVLERALWAAAKSPDDPVAGLALETAIKQEASELVEKNVTSAELITYLLEKGFDDNTLVEAQIRVISDELEAGLTESALTPEEQAEMKAMSNKEFLKKEPAARLKFVTKGGVESSAVASGEVSNLEFTFTYEGQYNEGLWKKTTAGQVLPSTVRSVTSGGTEFKREADSLSGEFFSVNGERLTIHEGTKLDAITTGDIAAIQTQINEKVEAFEGSTPEKLVARFALEKGIDPTFAQAFYVKEGEPIEVNDDETALTPDYRAGLEDFLTDVDRAKDAFVDITSRQVNEFNDITPEKNGRITPEFASFYMGYSGNSSLREEVMNKAGYTAAEISASQNWSQKAIERSVASGGAGLDMTELSDEDLEGILDGDPASIEQELKSLRRFPPGSPIAQKLFVYCALRSNMGLSKQEAIEWGKSDDLHYILSRESGGIVGRLNYTLRAKGSTLAEVKAGNKRGARSSATGLGQCLWENVDKYYPDGRSGIGDPINEAVGMLRYIRDRYGSPQVARSVYGRTGSYVHAATGRLRTKTFKEGY